MGDMKPNKKQQDIPALKEALAAALADKTHKEVATYGILLGEHVLALAAAEPCEKEHEAFAILRKWQANEAKFQQAREIAFALHSLARQEESPVRTAVLRTMGQIAAIPHVKNHALPASDYAVKLINLLHPGDIEAIRKERETQIALMKTATYQEQQ